MDDKAQDESKIKTQDKRPGKHRGPKIKTQDVKPPLHKEQ